MRPATHANVTYHLGRVAQKLDLSGKQVHDDHGDGHTFDKLLLETGGTTRCLPFGGDDVIYFRTLADHQRLQELAKLRDYAWRKIYAADCEGCETREGNVSIGSNGALKSRQ